MNYDKSEYYVDFSDRENLTIEEKKDLENIQTLYRPMERVDYLVNYRMMNKITSDDYEKMTGVPYSYD